VLRARRDGEGGDCGSRPGRTTTRRHNRYLPQKRSRSSPACEAQLRYVGSSAGATIGRHFVHCATMPEGYGGSRTGVHSATMIEADVSRSCNAHLAPLARCGRVNGSGAVLLTCTRAAGCPIACLELRGHRSTACAST